MKNIDRLIEFLKAETVAFNMNYWLTTSEVIIGTLRVPQELEIFNSCGTCACIGGSAEILSGTYDDAFLAMEWILEGIDTDLTKKDYYRLFYPITEDVDYGISNPNDDLYVSRERAIRVLENLRDTGKIDWAIR